MTNWCNDFFSITTSLRSVSYICRRSGNAHIRLPQATDAELRAATDRYLVLAGLAAANTQQQVCY